MTDESRTWKFWLWVSVVLVAILLVVGVSVDRHNRKARIGEHSDRLALLSELRREALQEYFDTVRAEITFWSLNTDLQSAGVELASIWRQLDDAGQDSEATLHRLYVTENPNAAGERLNLSDAGDGSAYSSLHAKLHSLARLFVLERGYYDFFLIDSAGNILYTVEKESDFATNLIDGPWKESGLADVFRRALEGAATGAVSFSDFASYPPSGNAPAMFAAKALTDPEGRTRGVLALQVPTDRIQKIMHFKAGMGESGETYLVGEDRLMRSDSRFSNESTILRTRVDTVSVTRALNGEQGVTTAEDYRGVPVLSAYTLVEIDRVRWAILAEIDEAEVLTDGGYERSRLSGVLSVLFFVGLAGFGLVSAGDWGGGGLGSFDADLSDIGDG
jgi:methyl-accepting chemotaxis protein